MSDKEPKNASSTSEATDATASAKHPLGRVVSLLSHRKVQTVSALAVLMAAFGFVAWKYWPRTKAAAQVSNSPSKKADAGTPKPVQPIPGSPTGNPDASPNAAPSSSESEEPSVINRMVLAGSSAGNSNDVTDPSSPAPSNQARLGSEVPTIPPLPPAESTQPAGSANGGSFGSATAPAAATAAASLTDDQAAPIGTSIGDQSAGSEFTGGPADAPPSDPLGGGGSFPAGGNLPTPPPMNPNDTNDLAAGSLPSPPADLMGAASRSATPEATENATESPTATTRALADQGSDANIGDRGDATSLTDIPPAPPATLGVSGSDELVPVQPGHSRAAANQLEGARLPTAPPVAEQIGSTPAADQAFPPPAPSAFPSAPTQPSDMGGTPAADSSIPDARPHQTPSFPPTGAPPEAAGTPAAGPPTASSFPPSPAPSSHESLGATPRTHPQGSLGAPTSLPTAPTSLPTAPTSLAAAPSAASSAAPTSLDMVRDTPGPRALEGVQTPAVTLHKVGPREVQVNRPATFKTIVRNTGRVPVKGVVVRDRVPRGTRLVRTTPPARDLGDGQLEWQFESLDPGTESEISLEVIPQTEGEIGSVATVHFAASATARAVSTRPELRLTVSGPRTALLGSRATLDINVSNEGSGAAEGVILQADVPEVLKHEKGAKLEYEIGTMAPGESKRLTLVLQAAAPGRGVNELKVEGAGGLVDRQQLDIEVIAPKLVAAIDGPKRRFLERKAEYSLQVGNAGTATAKNVSLVLQLPKGMQFVEAGVNGQYDPRLHVVRWNLEELPPQQQGEAKLVVLPIDTGAQLLRLEATAPLSEPAVYEHQVSVEALSELTFTISDSADPIELNSETVYEVKIRNQGSRPDTNIQLQVHFPPAIQAVEADGASQASADQNGAVTFAVVERLAPGDELTYRIRARGVQVGSHLVQAKVTSDQAGVLVTKEEQTRVYSDR